MEWITKNLLPLILTLSFYNTAHAQLGKWFGPGELSEAHESVKGISNCTSCHSTGAPHDKCLACHTDIKARLDLGKGFHAKHKDKKCATCHPEHKGAGHDLFGLDVKTFKHDDTGWPLAGAHQELKCKNCHKEKRVNQVTKKKTHRVTYLGLQSTCISCHKDVHDGKNGVTCENCHTQDAWKKLTPPTPTAQPTP